MHSPFVLFLLACLSCMFSGILPNTAFYFAMLWGCCLILLGFSHNRRVIFFTFAVNLGQIFMMTYHDLHAEYAAGMIFYALAVGAPCAVMGLMADEKKPYYTMRRTGLMLGLGGFILFVGVQMQNGLWSQRLNLIRENFTQLIEQMLNTGMLQVYVNEGMTQDMLLAGMEIILQMLPAWYFIKMLVAIYLVVTWFSFYALRHGQRWMMKRPFALEQLPWPWAWVMIGGMVLVLMDFSGRGTQFYVGLNLICVMTVVGLYYGCAVLSGKYHMYSPGKRRKAGIILFILCIFVPQMVGIFVVLLGILDSVANYRRIVIIKK